MSHVKAGGAVRQHHQRRGKRMGVKKFGGEKVQVGHVILKQKGAKYKAGKGVGMGHDYTIFSMLEGVVLFSKKWGKTVVNVVTQ
jgi:large subunit ribosomal protein L27